LASTVTSAPDTRPKRSSTARRIRTRSAAGSSVGVPPPKKTVDTSGRSPGSARAASCTSAIASAANPARASRPRSSDAVYVLKSQYAQREAQNGTCTYIPNTARP
jgi:hypothetical protein